MLPAVRGRHMRAYIYASRVQRVKNSGEFKLIARQCFGRPKRGSDEPSQINPPPLPTGLECLSFDKMHSKLHAANEANLDFENHSLKHNAYVRYEPSHHISPMVISYFVTNLQAIPCPHCWMLLLEVFFTVEV